MSFDLAHIWAHMGILGKVIAGILVLMAIASIGVVVERLIALRRVNRVSRAFAVGVAPLIDEWKTEDVVTLADKHAGSPLARLFGAMMKKYLKHGEKAESTVAPADMARNEGQRQREAIGIELRKGLNVLASVGSVTPFIGLLGTVVGIIAAFQGIATSGSGGIGSVSAGIAEALVETALGLLVAIPAVLSFNFLSVRITAVESTLEGSASQLVDEMEAHDERKRHVTVARKAAA